MFSEEENNTNIEVKENDIDINKKHLSLRKLILLFAIGFIGLFVVSFIIQLFLYFAPLDEVSKSAISNFVSYSVIFVSLILVINFDIKLFKNDFKNWTSYLFGLSIAILLVVITISYTNFINLFRTFKPSDNEEGLRKIVLAYPVLSILFFCFIGPMVEELTYRVGLFNIFIKKKWLAYLISIVIFALMHFRITSDDLIGELINLPVYLISGFALTLSYDKFGLGASLTAHICNNLYAIVSFLIVSNL